jgi:hypothetical protein
VRIVNTQAEAAVAALYAALEAKYGAKFQQADFGVREYGEEGTPVTVTSNMLVCGEDANVADTEDLREIIWRVPMKGAVVLDIYVYLGTEDDYGLHGNVDAIILDGELLGIACPFADKARHAAMMKRLKGAEVLP